jgi:hypothetical protein
MATTTTTTKRRKQTMSKTTKTLQDLLLENKHCTDANDNIWIDLDDTLHTVTLFLKQFQNKIDEKTLNNWHKKLLNLEYEEINSKIDG